MTRKNTDLKTLRTDLLNILGDPTIASASALRGAVQRWLRDATPGESLSGEILAVLSRRPLDVAGVKAALPHRRDADVSRTLHRLRRSGAVHRTPDNFFSRVA